MDRQKLKRHTRRARLQHEAIPGLQSLQQTASDRLPLGVQSGLWNSSLLRDHQSRRPERFLYHVDVLIKGSFEAGRWSFAGNDSTILSSPHQILDHRLVRKFGLSMGYGSDAAKSGDLTLAGQHWRAAFLMVESLTSSQYHRALPELFEELVEVQRQGFPEIAFALQRHIAQCAMLLSTSPELLLIFEELGRLDLSVVNDLEDRLLHMFS
jgi:hypothetical protein